MKVYCFDTSALIDAWVRKYPPRRFPAFWARLAKLIATRRVICPDAVRAELERKDDDLLAWCVDQPQLFVAEDRAVLEGMKAIIAKNQRLLENKPGRNGADPFVIALAQDRGCILVSEEAISSNPKEPRIPNICAAEGIRCVKLLGFLDEEEWTFS